MAVKLIAPPLIEPIKREDVEAHLRCDLTAESALIDSYIAAVRQQAEAITRRALITQTWELVLDEFPPDITLPFPPLQSVVSVKYIDTAGVEQTLSASSYIVDTDSEPARITPAYGEVWPSTRCQVNAVRIRFVCGYSFPLFDAATAYPIGSEVKYTNGLSYRAKVLTAAGELPTDATKWDVISESEAVPKAIKQWMLLQLGSMYENREAASKDAMNTMPFVDGLLSSYRVVRF